MSPSSAPARNLKQRVFTCITKLSDRDTQSLAATELESIARNLDANSVPVFLSCIHSTDASDKSPVRRQCVHVLEILSESHGNALSPYLSKILANIVRRLRDPDSSVRSACVNSVSALSSHITKQPFSSFLQPLTEALFTEQDQNSQMGAALCLAAAIDAAPDPDPVRLGKLLPKFEKLLKCEGFKAKPALLALIGSVVEAGGASTHGALRNLVPCVLDFLSSQDWAARKAAAEALVKLAIVERDMLSGFKARCMKVFENRRFDKVKVVREVMNQMLEAWKQISDVSDEFSSLPQSQASSKENASDGHYPAVSHNSCSPGSIMPQFRRKSFPILETSKKEKSRFSKPETKRALFSKNPDDKLHKFGSKGGSRVVPYHEESQNSVPVSNVARDLNKNKKDSQDLSLIRNQLLQIEKQQSNLCDLLQSFIGSSEEGMRALETRVHGLELALDGISKDLAISTGRMTSSSVSGNTCCLLPGAKFLSSKFWKKSQGRYSISRLSSIGGTPSLATMQYRADRNGDAETKFTNYRHTRGGGFFTNPLAEIHNNPRNMRPHEQSHLK